MTARTGDVDLLIFRMYFLFHCSTVLIWPIKANTDNKPHFDETSSQKVFQTLVGDAVERLNPLDALLDALQVLIFPLISDSDDQVVLRGVLGRDKFEYTGLVTASLKKH